MQVTVLGKYGPFSVNDGGTSSYLVECGENAVLLDAGSGMTSKMLSKIDINNLKFVVLSHMHFDHISDIFVLSYAVSFLKNDKKLKVYMFDDGSASANLIKNIKEFDIININTNTIYNDSGFTFSFYKMAHPVISHGVKLSCNNKTLAYTGDTTINGDLPSLIDGADLLIADGCFLSKDHNENKPHMSALEVANLSKAYNVLTIVSHIAYNYTDEEVELELSDYPLTTVAKEGTTYFV